jgi:hypothetical protein
VVGSGIHAVATTMLRTVAVMAERGPGPR